MPTPFTPRRLSLESVVETPRCIAVVDDDSAVRTSLSRLLRAGGYRIVAFASGNDFLKSLNVYVPDCVLAGMPAIIMSGSMDADLGTKALAGGVEN